MKYISHLSIFFLIWMLTACAPEKEKSEDSSGMEKSIPVHVMEIESRELPIIVETIGRLMPDREVKIASEIGGIIQEYYVDVGDKVSSGQILARIDPTDYQLAQDEAEANLEAAKARMKASEKSYERMKSLLPKNVVTDDTFEKAEAEYNSSVATVARMKTLLEICKERLKKTEIKAPFSGLIASRMTEKGQSVGIGEPLFTLSDHDPMRVKVFITEKDYVHLDKDDPVTILLEAFPGRAFNVRIDRMGIKADERTNTFDVDILIDNPDLFLKAGMSARVRITTMVIHDAIMIPQSTILYRNERMEVFILADDNRAVTRTVKLGRSDGSLIRIKEGLNVGDILITTGGQYLHHGDNVVIVSEDEMGGK